MAQTSISPEQAKSGRREIDRTTEHFRRFSGCLERIVFSPQVGEYESTRARLAREPPCFAWCHVAARRIWFLGAACIRSFGNDDIRTCGSSLEVGSRTRIGSVEEVAVDTIRDANCPTRHIVHGRIKAKFK